MGHSTGISDSYYLSYGEWASSRLPGYSGQPKCQDRIYWQKWWCQCSRTRQWRSQAARKKCRR